ncbi:MAG: carbohydrate ABC transporter permease [Propionibacteriaceae bacterium]|nr:carbohydrate ABC transporter permease [Micropruina sp.]HBX81067.1 carbohydrate ABC transporter permease [Propionibacteriaceae bacterium]HBY24705.1 carbohydrate ABC transporter permease [Propionibacteriaceae bacterium]
MATITSTIEPASLPSRLRPTSDTVSGRPLYYVVGIVLVILFLAPLLWSAWKSVTGNEAGGSGSGLGWDNYARLFAFGEGLPTYTWNSLFVAFLTVFGTLVISTLAGYGFSRFRFPGKNVIFVLILAILMVPHPTILIPIYKMFAMVGLQNSLVGLSLVMIMFQLPFGVFMMRNSFEALPRELEESALIDGCSRFQAMWRVLLRLTVPGLVTVSIFAFVASWNEFMAALVLLSSGKVFTLPIALVNLRSGDFGSVDLGALQAGVVVTAIPCVVLFLVLQRFYLAGFTSGAMKG